MTDVSDALVAVLDAHAGLGALADDRIYPLVLPEKPTLPSVVYQRITGTRIAQLGSTDASGKGRYLVQVTVWDDDVRTAHQVMDQVRAAVTGSSTFTGIHDSDFGEVYDEEARLYGVIEQYSIWI